MTALDRPAVDLMLSIGSDFEQCLARCAIEADTPLGFAKALAEAYAAADAINRAMIDRHLAIACPLAMFWDMSEADRRGALCDAFRPIFQRFAGMAEANAEAMS